MKLLLPNHVERGFVPRTLAGRQYAFNKFAAFLASKDAKKIAGSSWGTYTEADFRRFQYFCRDLGDPTTSHIFTSLRAFYDYMIERVKGFRPDNPLDPIHISIPDSLPKVLSADQVNDLLHILPKFKGQKRVPPWILFRDLAILEVLTGSGLRVAELVGIDIEDLNLDKKTPSVKVTGKGGKERHVPLLNSAVEAIANYRNVAPVLASGPLFISLRRTRPTTRAVQFIVRKYMLATRSIRVSTGMGPHIFRHSYATDLLNHNCSLEHLQALLGHESIDSTQIYTHVSLKHEHEVYNSCHPRA